MADRRQVGQHGERAALERYCGVPVSERDHLQNGLASWATLHPWAMFPGEDRVLGWQPHLDAVFADAGFPVVPLAAPFFFAAAMVEPEPTGTLYVPDHSTAWTPLVCDWERLADEWLAYPEPRTLCAYWYDLEAGHYEPFRERGYRIVSAGGLTDPDFLFRLAGYMLGADLIVSNQAQTNAVYGVLLGKPYLIPTERPAPVVNPANPEWPMTDHLERLWTTLADGSPENTPAKRAVCAEVCRSEVCSPAELAAALNRSPAEQ